MKAYSFSIFPNLTVHALILSYTSRAFLSSVKQKQTKEKSRHRNLIDEGKCEAGGEGRRVHVCMIGYVIQSSRALELTSSVVVGGVWQKIRWWGVRCRVPSTCSPLRTSLTSSTWRW